MLSHRIEISIADILTKGSNDISSQRRVRSTVHKCTRSRIPLTNTHQNGPSATSNLNPNWQLNSGRSNQQQKPTQKNKNNGYALSLVTKLRSPRPTQNLLAARKNQPRRLLYKIPSTATSCQRQVTISNQSQRSSRSTKSATGTRTDQFQISKKAK